MVHPAYFALPILSLGIAAIYYAYRSFRSQEHSAGGGPDVSHTAIVLSRNNAVRRRKTKKEYNEENECQICQDAEYNVEIYPCRHREICEKCIDVIITKLDRNCPFCRQYIQGYTNISVTDNTK
ncbi:hypothetical protein LOTGIDRAFT_232889 [Lottia gigantea]|uniref:RING-type domain-containing protein n=1 Tax=Lottia gigantea TaxID=225164 RepID=V4AH77_LOTGI|nr:hypothetical protein LOTGIDRAFT_232889 [Lottia gigantea]ESO92746.1 hypothetical protein LOTGIDRAFT_232889 [Lottia gigantea]